MEAEHDHIHNSLHPTCWQSSWSVADSTTLSRQENACTRGLHSPSIARGGIRTVISAATSKECQGHWRSAAKKSPDWPPTELGWVRWQADDCGVCSQAGQWTPQVWEAWKQDWAPRKIGRQTDWPKFVAECQNHRCYGKINIGARRQRR